MTKEAIGGTHWELVTAGDQMIAARRANDPDAEVLALIRFADGLRNSSLGVVGQVLAPLAEQIRALGEKIERSDQSRLDNRSELRSHIDDQFDAFGEELQGLRTDVQHAAVETARRLGKSEADIESLLFTQTEHAARLHTIEQADRDDIRAEIKDIKTALAQYEQ